ncbi:MAG TPA: cobalamin biosynthesis protein CbiX [Chromatiales bacterium]|nr:cobalamin biosynthesis protein CbiX [Chromatiales bacterium]
MRCLVLIAHGSRREASNNEVRRLAQQLHDRADGAFEQVTAAFLELAGPTIPEGIENCIRAGAEEVVVVPYFLAAGRHMREDIPALIDTVQRAHPEVEIRVTPYLGAAGGVVDLLLDLARATD